MQTTDQEHVTERGSTELELNSTSLDFLDDIVKKLAKGREINTI